MALYLITLQRNISLIPYFAYFVSFSIAFSETSYSIQFLALSQTHVLLYAKRRDIFCLYIFTISVFPIHNNEHVMSGIDLSD